MEKTHKPLARTARMNIRLTKDELDMIINKSRKCFHGNKTRFLVAATRSYDVVAKVQANLDIMKYSNIFNDITTELSRQGNNLNQIAHQLNTIMEESGNHPSMKKVESFFTAILDPFIKTYISTYNDFKEKYSRVLEEMIKRE